MARQAESWATTPGVRSRMQKQRSQNTGPEVELRRALHRRGLRFRIHQQIVPGTKRRVDIALGQSKVAVDVRGCYWHGHPHELRSYHRRNNLEYWQPKIARNKARDADTALRLRKAGWKLVVVWQCQDIEKAANRIATIVRTRRQ